MATSAGWYSITPGSSRLGIARPSSAPWLRTRLSRWSRRPWSGGYLDPEDGRARGSGTGVEAWRSAIDAYVAARRAVLPVGERDLLERWSRAERARVTVMETSPEEAAKSLAEQMDEEFAG